MWEILTVKKNIGYLPNMANARVCIYSILEFYQHEKGNQAFQKFFEERFGSKSENTLRLTQNTLVNYGLIRETDDYVFETTELGKKWLQNPTYEFLVNILNDRVEFIGELLLELQKKPCFADELIQKAAENYGFELGGSDLSRRMQILKAAEMVKMNRRKQYSITEKGRIFLNKIDREKVVGTGTRLESCDDIAFKRETREGIGFKQAFQDGSDFRRDSHDGNSGQFLHTVYVAAPEIDKELQIPTGKDTKLLYYYCSVSSFLDIIKNHRYCFSDLRTAENLDVMERIKKKVIEKVCEIEEMSGGFFSSVSEGKGPIEQFVNKVLDTIEYRMLNDIYDVLPCQFTMELADDVRRPWQWNENNGEEQVMAIGFDSRKLETLFRGRGCLDKMSDDGIQEEVFDTKIEILKNCLLVRYGAYDDRQENSEQVIKQTADALWDKEICDMLSPKDKDGRSNTDEKRWGLVLKDVRGNQNKPVWNPSRELSVKNGRIVPCQYIDEKTVGEFPVKRIILGPGCQMAMEEVSRWISFCGFGKERIEILKETGWE